jgi:hypothetical protein
MVRPRAVTIAKSLATPGPALVEIDIDAELI